MRYRETIVTFNIFFIVLFFGLFYLQIIQGHRYFSLSRRNIIRMIPFEAARGKILDRNGVVLADTKPGFELSVFPQEMNDKDTLFERLSKLLDIPEEKLYRNYKRNFVNVFTPVELADQLDKDRIITVEENKLALNGVTITAQPQRTYPFGMAGAHVLGYLSQIDRESLTRLKSYGYELSDIVGNSGIEESYDLILRGEKGGEQIEVDNRGRRVRTVGFRPPQSGSDIQLAIDIRIQTIVDTAMKDRKGAAIIMDPYSGEIIALGSYPAFDPNDFVTHNSKNIAALLSSSDSPLRNRVVSGQYPPGSTFKIITSISALEKDPELLYSHFNCPGYMALGSSIFKCLSTHGWQNLHDALLHSCNVFFYHLGLLVNPDIMKKYAHAFGLGRATGIDVKHEVNGVIPYPSWKRLMKFQNWYKGDTVNMSIGQGYVLVTPVQMVRLIAAFANGGFLVHPHVLKAIGDHELEVKDRIKVNIHPENLNLINNYLFDVVDNPEGTAHGTKITGLTIRAKTGTAQVVGKQPHGWFVGYVGREKPQYAFCVFLEYGGSSHYAVNVAREIFESMMSQELL